MKTETTTWEYREEKNQQLSAILIVSVDTLGLPIHWFIFSKN